MRWTAAFALAVVLSACGGSSEGLTQGQLQTARAKVHGFQPWSQAQTILTKTLGPPTSQDDAGVTWISHDGAKCHALKVMKMAKTVGTITLEETPCP